jgi:hypothetical protein
MALTLRSNGTNGGIVSAAWWNDYYDLLTGLMTDQIVTLKTTAIIEPMAGGAAAPTLALTAGTALGIGTYQYIVTFADANGGETAGYQSTIASISTTSGNQAVNLTNIPTGPTGTVKRYLYRTVAGGTPFGRCTTFNDNTTTTFTDTVPDASLGLHPQSHPSAGGTLIIKNVQGSVTAQIYSDGYLFLQNNIFWGGSLAGVNQAVLYMQPTDTGTKQWGLFYNTDNSIRFFNASDATTPLAMFANGSVTVGGVLTAGVGGLLAARGASGVLGTVASGDLLDVDNTGATYIKGAGYIYFQIPNGTTVAHFDNSGNLTLQGAFINGLSSAKMQLGSASLGDIHLVPGSGNFVYFDTSGAGAHVDSNGNIIATSFMGKLQTNRNGTTQVNTIFTGTNTPSSPNVGDIWIKA